MGQTLSLKVTDAGLVHLEAYLLLLMTRRQAVCGSITTDEYAPYEGAILEAFGAEVVPPRTGKPGGRGSRTRWHRRA